MDRLACFHEIVAVDFEFNQSPGERPLPVCLVGLELRSGRRVRLWKDQLESRSRPPYDTSKNTLFIAYFASAELSCHLALGWPMPARILDLYAEFRCLTSGLRRPNGSGLLGALSYFGLDAIDAVEKESMRQLILRGGSYSDDERTGILDYCQTDVDALANLLPQMLPRIDIPRALVRGRYMAAVAKMEWNGIPVDAPLCNRIKASWEDIQSQLIEDIDRPYGVYDKRTFKADRFAAWLAQHNIPWPRLESGNLALDDKTFHSMSKTYPEISDLRELRKSLSQLRLSDLAIGSDNRNRCLLSPFASKTGRNQPSNTKFVFGTSSWMRRMIKPPRGRALAYVDYCQQEFAIGGALSGDAAMQEAYVCGDPYLRFAVQAGAAPPDATKQTHGRIRELFKEAAIAVQYCMSAESLSQKLNISVARGRELLQLHRTTYPTYWRWSDSIRDAAMLHGRLQAVLGWTVHVGADANPRSLRNFPLQANGGEILRLACCMVTEKGIQVAAPIHDAILVEGPAEEIDEIVAETQSIMREASEVILDGFPLRSDADIVRYPDRYHDKRGKNMWEAVLRAIGGEHDA